MHMDSTPAYIVSRTCEVCGDSFQVDRYRVKQGYGRFCSRACFAVHRIGVPTIKPRPVADRFWEKVDQSSADGCWLWTAARNRRGYGTIGIGGRNGTHMLAHRLSWELHNGTIPKDLCVLHHCDVPACVNPDHLFLGTRADNNADMRTKGRMASGDRHPLTKLSAADITAIRTRYASGDVPAQEIADEYGVTRSYMYAVIRGDHRTDAPLVSMRPRRMKYEWSRDYPACVSCGTTTRRHNAKGLCISCYWKQHQRS